MIILIDAYNFIKSVTICKFVDEKTIQSWILQFKSYAACRKNSIILIFDAGPMSFQTKENHGLVQVVYAGWQKTADDAIKNWLDCNKGKDVLLVTSDRQIRQYASNLSVTSISSQDFFTIFQEKSIQEVAEEIMVKGLIYKIHQNAPENDQDLDELMEAASRNVLVQKDESEYSQNSWRDANHAGKNKSSKALDKKIKKL